MVFNDPTIAIARFSYSETSLTLDKAYDSSLEGSLLQIQKQIAAGKNADIFMVMPYGGVWLSVMVDITYTFSFKLLQIPSGPTFATFNPTSNKLVAGGIGYESLF